MNKGLIMTEYVYSLDNERYYELEDFEDMLLGLCEDSETPKNSDMEIYRAEKVLRNHASFINANSILETISQNAYDEAGEYAESYCDSIDHLSSDKVKELEQLINDFFDKYIGQPNFYTVKNAMKIKYKDINEST